MGIKQRQTHGSFAPFARAWDWRRRLDRGEVATIRDVAATEGVTNAFVSRFPRLAYLSPNVLERLLIHRQPCALSLDRLALVRVGTLGRAGACGFR